MRNTARYWNVAFGIWLLISAFLWPHTSAQYNNAIWSGIACAVIAMIGMGYGPARYLNSALGIWLAISTFTLPTDSGATFWNHLIVGIAVFLASLAPGRFEPVRPVSYPAQGRYTERGGEARP